MKLSRGWRICHLQGRHLKLVIYDQVEFSSNLFSPFIDIKGFTCPRGSYWFNEAILLKLVEFLDNLEIVGRVHASVVGMGGVDIFI